MLLLLGSALAADVVTQGELSSRARDLARLNMGGVVLVAETEPDRVLVDARVTDGVLPRFVVVTASSTDLPAAALAAATSTGTRCALVMSSPVQAMWKVAAYGECAGVFTETAIALPPPGTAPEGGAKPVPTWPSGAEPKATPAPSPAPAPTPTPPVAPAPQGATPEKLRMYKARHLVRGPLNYVVPGVTTYSSGVLGGGAGHVAPSVQTTPPVHVVSWGVFDGGGAPFSALQFAGVTGDEATGARLQAELERARTTTLAAGVAAGALAVVSFASFAMAFEEDDASQRPAALPLGAVSLIGATTAASVAVLASPLAQQRQRSVPRYYEPSAADSWIEKHNAKLREELGLSETDVQQIDLMSRRVEPTLQLAMAPGALVASATF